jgi:asparagine synthase (glutamine-hydrolysing)
VPIRHWLKDEIYNWVINLIRSSPTDYRFNKKEIFSLLEGYVANKRNNSQKLWTILVFMVWHQVFIAATYEFNYENEGMQKQTTLTN